MRLNKQIVFSTVLAGLTVGGYSAAMAQTQNPVPAPVPEYKHEKCFGIVKAGKNDCATAASSCASTAKRDAQGDAWVYLPTGTCAKIQGASLSPKKA